MSPNKNDIGRNEFTEEKKERAVDCAFEIPSVFTPTVDEELTMFFTKYTKNSLTEKN